MKTFITTFFFILLCTSLGAQHIIDLSRLDYIHSDENSLDGYLENHNRQYAYVDIDGDTIDGGRFAMCDYEGYINWKDSLRISDFDEDSIYYYEDYIKVSDIPTRSIAQWEDLLDKHDMLWNDEDDDLETLQVLMKKSRYYMQKIKLEYNKEARCCVDKDCNKEVLCDRIHIKGRYYNSIDNYYYHSSKYDVCYIKLAGDKYLLCLINDNDIYKFIPQSKQQRGSLLPLKLEGKLSRKRLKRYSQESEAFDFFTEKNGEGRVFIVNRQDMPIGISGDRIVSSYQGPTAVYDKASNNYALYDPFLNRVEHNYNIRYAKPGQGGTMTLLIGNEMVTMLGGEIGYQGGISVSSLGSVCGTVNRYKDEIVYDADGTIKLEHIVDGRMVAKGVDYYSYNITNAQDIDSLYFEGQTSKFTYSDNTQRLIYASEKDELFSRSGNNGESQLLYGKMKNGKYNLFASKFVNSEVYKEVKLGRNPTVIEQELYGMSDTTYSKGEMVLQPIFPRDVDCFTTSGRLPFIYNEGELTGIFPLHSEAKYTDLRFGNTRNDSLMRYQLPSGKKGWLDIYTGEELEDI